jgi:hypothetical protein
MRFQCHVQCQKLKNYIENAIARETHIQTADPKRKFNQPLKKLHKKKKKIVLHIVIVHLT